MLFFSVPTLLPSTASMMSRYREAVAMSANRVWIEIVLLGTVVALALALLFATLGAAAGVAVGEVAQATPDGSAQSFEGMITCSRCGAKHQPALDRSASACVRVCVHGGATFALVDDDSVYLLDGEVATLKRLAGQRAHIFGTRVGNTIRIASITSES
jgi:hypothetical protein